MITALLIPAYKPEDKLIELAGSFANIQDIRVVVVDDGSGEEFRDVFSSLPQNVTLLRHDVNKGKGRALKTGILYIKDEMPFCGAVITADADGQHKFSDIMKIKEVICEHTGALVMGSRRFDGNVPLRSRFGNTVTRHVFSAASGVKVSDTQTGLRAFSRELFDKFAEIDGERYEYEINMLLYAAQSGIPICEIPIETVYYDDNAHSHFDTFKDSFRIYLCFIKFASSSFVSFIIDFIMLLLLRGLTSPLGEELSLLLSAVGARMVSSTCNFIINRKIVFHANERLIPSLLKYIALTASVLIVNYLLLRLLNITLSMPLVPAKLLVELTLFIANFFLQGKVVFRSSGRQKRIEN